MTKVRSLFLAAMALLCATSIHAQIITTYAGNYAISPAWSGDGGPATAAAMNVVYSVAVDNAGNLYIGEANYRIRKVTPSGIISTIAGNGTYGYTGDGGPATAASIGTPAYIALDGMGNLYIAINEQHIIRKVAPSGTITTFAGNGSPGYSGDGGPAVSAAIGLASGIAADNFGNVYFTDYAGSVRKVDFFGTISRVAGTGMLGYSGDGGPATAAELFAPSGITCSGTDIYIADEGNNVIRKVNASGIISTVAGNGVGAGAGSTFGSYSGDGGPALMAGLNGPIGIAVNETTGDMFISDRHNHRIRKVDASGIISTYTGNGIGGYSGDGGPANSAFARINWNWGLALDGAGRLYIADELNYVVRRIDTSSNIPPSTGESGTAFTCTETPVHVDTIVAVIDPNIGQTASWTLVSGPYHGSLAGSPATATTTGSWVYPSGLIYTPDAGFYGLDTFTVEVCDAYNCVLAKRFVFVDSVMSAGALSGSATVCVGDTILLTATVPGGTWVAANANATVSAGSVIGISGGSVDVWYIVTSGCGQDTATHTLMVNADCTSGITNAPGAVGSLRVMPNPSLGSFTVTVPASCQAVRLLNVMGAEVARQLTDHNGATFHGIPSGSYMVVTEGDGNIWRQRIVVW